MMVTYTTTIKKFDKQGEKTGWTYVDIPADIANRIKKGQRTSFRVKGTLDGHAIQRLALLPMGDGAFILPLNATLRKMIGKRQGSMVTLSLTTDETPFKFNKDLLACLADEPSASTFFKSLPGSHQRYFSKWVDDAKTETTKTKRIAMAVDALRKKHGFSEMLRASRKA